MLRFQAEVVALVTIHQVLADSGGLGHLSVAIDEEGQITIFTIDPFGEVETLPTNERTLITPSEAKRPIPVSIILQNARVIQVGEYFPGLDVQPPTPTPEPIEEGEPTPTPEPNQRPTATPVPPTTVVVALSPQQQLFLKYAIESNADIDLALRGVNDGQLYPVQNVDIEYLLESFHPFLLEMPFLQN